jgi:hypothetical protein
MRRYAHKPKPAPPKTTAYLGMWTAVANAVSATSDNHDEAARQAIGLGLPSKLWRKKKTITNAAIPTHTEPI